MAARRPHPAPSGRTRVRRLPHRGAYDRASIDAVLDAGLVAHLGFVHDGQPFVIPRSTRGSATSVYVHGSAASRTLRQLAAGIPACLTVTLLDGIVLARSVFEHSMNYRSVVVLGTAVPVEEVDEKLVALEAFTEKLLPGRWAEARAPTRKELKATTVLRLPLDEASAKIRDGRSRRRRHARRRARRLGGSPPARGARRSSRFPIRRSARGSPCRPRLSPYRRPASSRRDMSRRCRRPRSTRS